MNPTGQVAVDHAAQRMDMRGIVVEARDIGEVLSACFLEAFLNLFVDLFQRLDAIGGKRGGADGDVGLAVFLSQPCDLFNRVGFQPFLGAETALECGLDLVSSQPSRSFSKRVVFWHWQW